MFWERKKGGNLETLENKNLFFSGFKYKYFIEFRLGHFSKKHTVLMFLFSFFLYFPETLIFTVFFFKKTDSSSDKKLS